MLKNALDTILTISEKHYSGNYGTGVYRHPKSKQRAFNAIAQVKLKQQLAPTQTSSFRHLQNPQHQNNQHQDQKLSLAENDRRDKEALCLYYRKGRYFASKYNQKKNNHN
jgi:hypothetical protein